MAKPNGQIDRRRFLFAEKCREWQYSIQVSEGFCTFPKEKPIQTWNLYPCTLFLRSYPAILTSHLVNNPYISNTTIHTGVPSICYEKVSKSRLPFLISTVHVGSLCVAHMRCLVTLWHDWIYLFIFHESRAPITWSSIVNHTCTHCGSIFAVFGAGFH